MRKNLLTRIFAYIFFAVGMLALIYYIYEKYISTNIYTKSSNNEITQIADSNKIQYRFTYKGSGNLKQIIHLNKGEAIFTSTHKGDGDYVVALKNSNDSLIKIIFNTKGDFKGYELINVSENDAYILDIKTDGEWEITYK